MGRGAEGKGVKVKEVGSAGWGVGGGLATTSGGVGLNAEGVW